MFWINLSNQKIVSERIGKRERERQKRREWIRERGREESG